MDVLRPLLKISHALLWLAGVLVLFLLLALCALAYGIPGEWLQPRLDAAIPISVGRLSVRHVAFRPVQGLVVEGLALRNGDGKLLAGFSRGAFGFRLFSSRNLPERLRNVVLEDLFVAQIEYSTDSPSSETSESPCQPFPDLSGVDVPQFQNVSLRLVRPNVVEVSANTITGILDAKDGTLRFHGLKGDIDSAGQTAEAKVDVDIRDAKVVASIRGFIFQTRLNGIYRALNLPIIEEYSNRFVLNGPAWGDCTFTVGLDKYRNLFSMRVDIVSSKGGNYCGVPFDEAQGTIQIHGIWDAVTIIEPLVARRNGKVVASGRLRFDCPTDRFEFRAEGDGLQPSECLRLIDMPFTEAIPAMTCTRPPEIRIEGAIPLMAEQTPAKVELKGHVNARGGGIFERIPLASAETDLTMTNGVFALRGLRVALPNGGRLEGAISFEIPPHAKYSDLSTTLRAEDASLADLLSPFGLNTLTNCVANGFINLRCRTDATLPTSLQADYDMTVSGGLIGRLPLFAGLTDLVADSVPGVSSLTDSSTARLVGAARNGIFSIPDFVLTGDIFSIEGPVTYDLPKDNVEAFVIAGIFKKDSLMGTLTRWAAVPFTKLMWQVQVSGPIANPKWHVLTIVEKLWDRALGK